MPFNENLRPLPSYAIQGVSILANVRRRGDPWPEGFRLDETERHAAHLFCTRSQRHIVVFNINVTRQHVLDEIQKHVESHNPEDLPVKSI